VLTEHKFDSRDAASAAIAARMAGLVGARLDRDGEASFVVGGGTTPQRCFDYLSEYDLDWDKIQVALSDERWVPNDHDDSNERLVRDSMLKDAANSGHILSVYQAGLCHFFPMPIVFPKVCDSTMHAITYRSALVRALIPESA